jgi:sporulation protein YlmC with PRC-barrel domain
MQNRSFPPKEVKMKLHTLAASTVLAAALLSSAVLPAAAKEEMLLTTVPNNGVTVSEYYKQSVYDTKDNKIGDVNDVLLDKSGQVSAVILGVGGFLGMGEKDVAATVIVTGQHNRTLLNRPFAAKTEAYRPAHIARTNAWRPRRV